MLRPHRLRLTVLIFLLLATSASRGWGQSDQRIATVLVVTGVAEVRASGEAMWDQLRFRDAIFVRDTVRTAANSRVKFLMRDDAILTLGEDGEMEFTEFLLTQQQQRNVIDLFLGALKVVTVRILRSGSLTQVRTSNTVAGVRGTSFIVRFIPPNITEVFVLEGIVTVQNLAAESPQVESVPPNQQTSVTGSAAPATPTTTKPEVQQSLNQEVSVTEQVPSEVTPTQELAPPEPVRGEESAAPAPEGAAPATAGESSTTKSESAATEGESSTTQSVAPPGSATVVLPDIAPVTETDLTPTIDTQIEIVSGSSPAGAVDPGDTLTSDTTPVAEEVLRMLLLEFTIEFPR